MKKASGKGFVFSIFKKLVYSIDVDVKQRLRQPKGVKQRLRLLNIEIWKTSSKGFVSRAAVLQSKISGWHKARDSSPEYKYDKFAMKN